MRDAAKKDAAASRPSSRPGSRYPRDDRLVRRAQFEAVYRTGRRRSSLLFVIFCCPNGRNRSRFGMSVKKTLGGAVLRNRIRRRIREALRQHGQEIAPGWDVVIHPRNAVAIASFPAIALELVQLLHAASASGGPAK